MIKEEQILKIVEEKISGTEKFIVDVAVKSGNKITVEIDSPQGININDCIEIHRFIESKFDREIDDFELTVSSPGLEEPFKILKQYLKNIGRNVRVILKDGRGLEGKLISADEIKVEISQTKKEKVNGKKQISEKIIPIKTDEIKQTKLII